MGRKQKGKVGLKQNKPKPQDKIEECWQNERATSTKHDPVSLYKGRHDLTDPDKRRHGKTNLGRGRHDMTTPDCSILDTAKGLSSVGETQVTNTS